MDISKKYIEMCHGVRPYIEVGYANDPVFYCKCGKKWEPIVGRNPIKAEGLGHWRVQLFREDDLHSLLLSEKKQSNMGLIKSVSIWLERGYPSTRKYKSMEQIWLGYTMAAMFLKTWDGRSGWIDSDLKTKIN